MPLYRVAPTGQLPHTIDLIQRQSAPRFANEIERDQQYPDPEIGALAVINTNVQVFNGTGWIPVGGGAPTLINHLQDVDARVPPDGAVLTWSSAAQAWGWSMPATPEPTCITFTDNFERADGPVGANWVSHPLSEGDFIIEDGAAILADLEPTSFSIMYWHATMGADDQSIEIELEAAAANYASVTLHTRFNDDYSGISAKINFNPDDGEVWVEVIHAEPGSGSTLVMIGPLALPAEPVDYRLESDADGTVRFYENGSLLSTVLDPSPLSGPRVGIESAGSFGAAASPRILSVTGGCLE